MKRGVISAVVVLLVALLATVLVLKYKYKLDYADVSIHQTTAEKTYKNYREQTAAAAKKYDLPQEYLLALIVLESSGRKIVPHRFEKHVYAKLDAVARSKQSDLEGITSKQLYGMSVGNMKKLASSWGPFQIMGYKSFEIGADIDDLHGTNAVKTGAQWIDKNYGEYLRAGHFKDAFHIHNTGKQYPKISPPKTYNKNYVPKGLKYMDEFRKMIKSN